MGAAMRRTDGAAPPGTMGNNRRRGGLPLHPFDHGVAIDTDQPTPALFGDRPLIGAMDVG